MEVVVSLIAPSLERLREFLIKFAPSVIALDRTLVCPRCGSDGVGVHEKNAWFERDGEGIEFVMKYYGADEKPSWWRKRESWKDIVQDLERELGNDAFNYLTEGLEREEKEIAINFVLSIHFGMMMRQSLFLSPDEWQRTAIKAQGVRLRCISCRSTWTLHLMPPREEKQIGLHLIAYALGKTYEEMASWRGWLVNASYFDYFFPPTPSKSKLHLLLRNSPMIDEAKILHKRSKSRTVECIPLHSIGSDGKLLPLIPSDSCKLPPRPLVPDRDSTPVLYTRFRHDQWGRETVNFIRRVCHRYGFGWLVLGEQGTGVYDSRVDSVLGVGQVAVGEAYRDLPRRNWRVRSDERAWERTLERPNMVRVISKIDGYRHTKEVFRDHLVARGGASSDIGLQLSPGATSYYAPYSRELKEFTCCVEAAFFSLESEWQHWGIEFGKGFGEKYSFALAPQQRSFALFYQPPWSESLEPLVNWAGSWAIKEGTEYNRVTLVCQSSEITLYVNDVYLGSWDRFPLPPWGVTRLFIANPPGSLRLKDYRLSTGALEAFTAEEERANLLWDLINSDQLRFMHLSGLPKGTLLRAPMGGCFVVVRDFLGIRVLVLRSSYGELMIFSSGDNIVPLRKSYEYVHRGELIGRMTEIQGGGWSIIQRQSPKLAPPYILTRAFMYIVPFGVTLLSPTDISSAKAKMGIVAIPGHVDEYIKMDEDNILMAFRGKDGAWLDINFITIDGKIVVQEGNFRSYSFREELIKPRLSQT